ncbi:hypothetical protein Taro_022937 [Colocasia esculenta]|uniref:Uncharacterized protein n=1 Tax=Colocasia esculenta TaxID=4460 RepID=A0A843V529_COLES|nr:hypothetical protein [Colocasia esculenta]
MVLDHSSGVQQYQGSRVLGVNAQRYPEGFLLLPLTGKRMVQVNITDWCICRQLLSSQNQFLGSEHCLSTDQDRLSTGEDHLSTDGSYLSTATGGFALFRF